ncbi:HD-GYP domain-containing protein [Bacillus solitudinis]|uniref:HD-GYP domain-containing protein n=1 Tax=Bacillus solitudinis TaxID=2014074 RepID=UPI000C23F0F9|nr:HD-GYP domain-containing protein [Bacillus solitudinis]
MIVASLSQSLRAYQGEKKEALMLQTMTELKQIFHNDQNHRSEIRRVETYILSLVKEMSEEKHLAGLMHDLQVKDDYTYRHNIGVSIISSMLAKWLNLTDEEINQVTLGGLVHDIGKARIDKNLLTKPGALSNEEYSAIKLHTILGYEFLKEDGSFSKEVCLMALEHHERGDGTGYPHQKKASQISYYSKIIAIADVFHAMTSDRVYRKGLSFYDVLREMKNDSFGRLDPLMIQVFIRKLMNMSIGNRAELNNGLIVEILFIPQEDPINPLVRSHKEFIAKKSALYREAYSLN